MREVTLVVDRAGPDVLDRGHSGAVQALRGCRLEVDVASDRMADRRVDLLARLVAARPGARPDRGVQLAAGTEAAQHRDAALDDAAREPAPAAVEHRHAVPGAQRDRQAVGNEDERGHPLQPRRLAIGLAGPVRIARRLAVRAHLAAADLLAAAELEAPAARR